MRAYNLGFITDEAIYTHVKDTVARHGTLADLVGFHRGVLCHALGWELSEESPFHLANPDKHIYVTLTEKCTALPKAKLSLLRVGMFNKLLHDREATCLLAETIPGTPQDESWHWQGNAHPQVRRMSADKLYALVFGVPDAYLRLHLALPAIIHDTTALDR